jgi:hypothetical protein
MDYVADTVALSDISATSDWVGKRPRYLEKLTLVSISSPFPASL